VNLAPMNLAPMNLAPGDLDRVVIPRAV
jgi:hypothetical protein